MNDPGDECQCADCTPRKKIFYRANTVLLGVAMAFLLLGTLGCRSKTETDSFLVIEVLQRRGLIHWYTPDQREVLRQEIQHTLENKR